VKIFDSLINKFLVILVNRTVFIMESNHDEPSNSQPQKEAPNQERDGREDFTSSSPVPTEAKFGKQPHCNPTWTHLPMGNGNEKEGA
jgi:hypothetical protein